MTKLYVGNLPFAATEEAVRNLFAAHGSVKVNEADGRDRSGGANRGPRRY